MKCRSQSGLRAAPTCCSYSRDGNLIASGCSDGSIQMWDHRKFFVIIYCLFILVFYKKIEILKNLKIFFRKVKEIKKKKKLNFKIF